MPRPTNSTQNPPTATSAPASTATPIEPEDELDETATGDDTPPATPPATRPALPRREDEEESLFAAAKRNLGLPADASPTDLLRALAVGGVERLRPAGPPRAACKLVVVVDGKRLVIEPDQEIPAGVDLATLPPHAVKGR